MKADVSLYLDTRRALKNGKYPLKLHVYFPVKNEKLFPLDYELSVEEFENSYLVTKPKKEYQELKIELDEIFQKATEIAKELGELITLEKFERKMFRSKASTTNVIDHFEAKRIELEDNDQIGTASTYDSAIKSIRSFFDEDKRNPITFLGFSALSAEVLNKYEKWMVAQDNSKTTVGIYMRNLRHIFNRAIKDGIVHPEFYPFKTYRIPNGKNVKKALENNELKSIYTAKVEPGGFIEKARDFWFFSYQCNGMNFRDIAELKWKNVHNTYFSFLRHKTINTTKEDPTPIVVPLTPNVEEFIKKYGNKRGKLNDYVFPIFQPGMTAKERHRANQNFIRFVNQHMKTLAADLKMDIHLATMEARHTYTTQVTRTMGLEFAQEALGHTTMNTTQNYWKGFEQETKRQMANKLMDFAKPVPVKRAATKRNAKRMVRKVA
jgi:integrase/recombinase XerD